MHSSVFLRNVLRSIFWNLHSTCNQNSPKRNPRRFQSLLLLDGIRPSRKPPMLIDLGMGSPKRFSTSPKSFKNGRKNTNQICQPWRNQISDKYPQRTKLEPRYFIYWTALKKYWTEFLLYSKLFLTRGRSTTQLMLLRFWKKKKAGKMKGFFYFLLN